MIANRAGNDANLEISHLIKISFVRGTRNLNFKNKKSELIRIRIYII